VFVPRGTPPAIVRTLNGTINEAIRAPDVKERFEQLNIESRPNTPEEFRAFVKDQIERWGKVVKEANIRLG
jgi:tripartite-type tricarboxylate transporter receptor subunit TctC